MTKKYELATLVDGSKLPELKQIEQYLHLVNQDPPKQWLEDHPLAKGVKYLPIERVEWLLTELFQEWRVEVIDSGQLLNSIYCHVRLHYNHPIKGWTSQDGLAAVPAKTAKGKKASDMTEILSEAVMTGLPAAKSFAIKDAADHIGKIFGRDINRKANIAFVGSYDREQELSVEQQVKSAKSIEELAAVQTALSAEDKRAFNDLIKNRVEELQNASN